jgi:hypothetical protein
MQMRRVRRSTFTVFGSVCIPSENGNLLVVIMICHFLKRKLSAKSGTNMLSS